MEHNFHIKQLLSVTPTIFQVTTGKKTLVVLYIFAVKY